MSEKIAFSYPELGPSIEEAAVFSLDLISYQMEIVQERESKITPRVDLQRAYILKSDDISRRAL